jgi:hypothetical protein
MFKKTITDFCGQIKSTNFLKTQKRQMMLLHEYQAQGLLKKYSIPTPKVHLKLNQRAQLFIKRKILTKY